MKEEGFIYVSNFSDSFSLCVAPVTSLSGEQEHVSVRWLGLIFDCRDKEALFFTALKVFNPAAAVGGRISAEDHRVGRWEELMTQFERSVSQATTQLPMLRRLKEEYEGANFSPNEVSLLREESLKVRMCSDDPTAVAALDKLIQASDEALKERAALIFYSD